MIEYEDGSPKVHRNGRRPKSVKLQPSKLALRVRFPLPAPLLNINELRHNSAQEIDFPNTFYYTIQAWLWASIAVWMTPRPTDQVEGRGDWDPG